MDFRSALHVREMPQCWTFHVRSCCNFKCPHQYLVLPSNILNDCFHTIPSLLPLYSTLLVDTELNTWTALTHRTITVRFTHSRWVLFRT